MSHPEPPIAVCFERATLADLDRLLELNALAFAEDETQNGRGPASYKNPAWHRNAALNHHYFKMELEGETVGGMVAVDRGEGHYFLDTLFIGPAYQNLGLGQRAMRFLEQAFPEARLWSLVTPHKSYRNHHFYAKMGYQKTGEIFKGDEPGLMPDFTLFVYEKHM